MNNVLLERAGQNEIEKISLKLYACKSWEIHSLGLVLPEEDTYMYRISHVSRAPRRAVGKILISFIIPLVLTKFETSDLANMTGETNQSDRH